MPSVKEDQLFIDVPGESEGILELTQDGYRLMREWDGEEAREFGFIRARGLRSVRLNEALLEVLTDNDLTNGTMRGQPLKKNPEGPQDYKLTIADLRVGDVDYKGGVIELGSKGVKFLKAGSNDLFQQYKDLLTEREVTQHLKNLQMKYDLGSIKKQKGNIFYR